MGAITEGKYQKQDVTVNYRSQIGNTDSSELLSLDHEQKPRRSFCKLTRRRGHAHKRDIRPLSSSLRFSDGTKESGVLCAVRLASADDSPRPPSLSYGQVISDNGLHRCVYDRQDCKRGSGAHTTSSRDGRNSSRGETIVREQGEGGRETGSTCLFAPATAAAEEVEEEEEEFQPIASLKFAEDNDYDYDDDEIAIGGDEALIKRKKSTS
ncbi:hypothetical protein ALC62_14503 [Cyphomyrmex costatus]|uniref:Uncharacterized protein n=1 Tax=Cyphomyrmex costatus TaxID=456900 RepID=A0A195C405_9HYME|nr:hypothetical protein ALC62_14503 [Cyphomyrmex costatus]